MCSYPYLETFLWKNFKHQSGQYKKWGSWPSCKQDLHGWPPLSSVWSENSMIQLFEISWYILPLVLLCPEPSGHCEYPSGHCECPLCAQSSFSLQGLYLFLTGEIFSTISHHLFCSKWNGIWKKKYMMVFFVKVVNISILY